MEGAGEESSNSGRRPLAIGLTLVACLAVAGVAWAAASGRLGGDAPAEPEVCDATVYEGCPGRWDYLINGDG